MPPQGGEPGLRRSPLPGRGRLQARAYVLESGRVVREGPSRALMDDPEIRRAYLGL